jgi:hypothetical protein
MRIRLIWFAKVSRSCLTGPSESPTTITTAMALEFPPVPTQVTVAEAPFRLPLTAKLSRFKQGLKRNTGSAEYGLPAENFRILNDSALRFPFHLE